MCYNDSVTKTGRGDILTLYQTSTIWKKLDFINGIISLATNVHQTNLHSGFSDQVVHLAGTLQVIHCANLSADTLFSWDLTPEFYKE